MPQMNVMGVDVGADLTEEQRAEAQRLAMEEYMRGYEETMRVRAANGMLDPNYDYGAGYGKGGQEWLDQNPDVVFRPFRSVDQKDVTNNPGRNPSPAPSPAPAPSPSPAPSPAPASSGPLTISTARLAEAVRNGIDLNSLSQSQLGAFASGGLQALVATGWQRPRQAAQAMWNEEAANRPPNPNLMA